MSQPDPSPPDSPGPSRPPNTPESSRSPHSADSSGAPPDSPTASISTTTSLLISGLLESSVVSSPPTSPSTTTSSAVDRPPTSPTTIAPSTSLIAISPPISSAVDRPPTSPTTTAPSTSLLASGLPDSPTVNAPSTSLIAIGPPDSSVRSGTPISSTVDRPPTSPTTTDPSASLLVSGLPDSPVVKAPPTSPRATTSPTTTAPSTSLIAISPPDSSVRSGPPISSAVDPPPTSPITTAPSSSLLASDLPDSPIVKAPPTSPRTTTSPTTTVLSTSLLASDLPDSPIVKAPPTSPRAPTSPTTTAPSISLIAISLPDSSIPGTPSISSAVGRPPTSPTTIASSISPLAGLESPIVSPAVDHTPTGSTTSALPTSPTASSLPGSPTTGRPSAGLAISRLSASLTENRPSTSQPASRHSTSHTVHRPPTSSTGAYPRTPSEIIPSNIPGTTSRSWGPSRSAAAKRSGKKELKSIKEVKARKKKEMAETSPQQDHGVVFDPYANSIAANFITRGQTGVVYDGEVLKHRCEWDDRHPEHPLRLTAIMDKCFEKGYLGRCRYIPNYLRTDIYEKILLVHTRELFETLKMVCQSESLRSMEMNAANYDSIYFNRHSFDASCRSLSSVLNLVFSVAKRDTHNGMAFVRPPGHHAMNNEFNGYCFFNNVAIAAEACIRENYSKRILIVDIDVHHGQGIQQMFYDRKDVLYISVHRYEQGTFWPSLPESNFNYIGKGDGVGYNVNVPLNATGLTDEDYLAILLSIVLPIGYEFNPDLIILSAGYDAALGCPEGKMNVTPGFYSHLITLLSGLARGQIAVCLEGGYFPPTLSEGAVMTLKALLGGPCPMLGPIRNVHPSVIETICNVRRILLNRWKCFSFCETIPPNEIGTSPDEHQFKICYFGKKESAPFLTRRCYPENTEEENVFYSKMNKALREKYRASMDLPVHYVYDEKMMKHAPKKGDVERPERGERLKSIANVFKEYGIDKRCQKIEIIKRDFTPYNPHDPAYFKAVSENLPQSRDVYVNEFTRDCVMIAVSGLLTLSDSIMSGAAGCGVAIVRPPGHHAEYNKAMGFCFANNVAICANYLHQKYNVQRILIVDFDIHHGNGTQNMFYEDKHVLYISIHRHDNGKFFPPNSHRDYVHDGHGLGQGFNINIPFNKDKMGDTEYIAAFHNIVLPAAYSYNPEVVIVSAGFDAGINDPLGGYSVSPETFGHFIQMLKPLAEGKIILSLEGGYNLTTTAYAMGICVKVLLGDPVVMPKNVYKTFSREAINTIRKVTDHFKKYYNIFEINKKLAITPILCRKLDNFTEDSYNSELYRVLDIDKVEDSEYVEEQLKSFQNAREY